MEILAKRGNRPYGTAERSPQCIDTPASFAACDSFDVRQVRDFDAQRGRSDVRRGRDSTVKRRERVDSTVDLPVQLFYSMGELHLPCCLISWAKMPNSFALPAKLSSQVSPISRVWDALMLFRQLSQFHFHD